MNKIIFFTSILFIANSLYSQENNAIDSTKKSHTIIVKDSRVDKLNETFASSYKLIGYRIQIYSGNSKQPAREARQRFSQLYRQTKAHESYEQPYFKVKVGDFKTKLEALKLKHDLSKHFPNCFIVKDVIEFKE